MNHKVNLIPQLETTFDKYINQVMSGNTGIFNMLQDISFAIADILDKHSSSDVINGFESKLINGEDNG